MSMDVLMCMCRCAASLVVVSTREKVAERADRAVKTVVAAYAEKKIDARGTSLFSELFAFVSLENRLRI